MLGIGSYCVAAITAGRDGRSRCPRAALTQILLQL